MNILFLNVGRRCELVREFKRVLPSFSGGGQVYGSDINPLAPALSKVDESVIFPHSSDKSFPSAFISFCQENEIGLVIPTIDPDLRYLSEQAERFRKELPNTLILVPDLKIVEMTEDKKKTKEFFAENGALVPEAVLVAENMDFPVFVKPSKGSAGEGARVIGSKEALVAHLKVVVDPIIEKVVEGPEYTVDVFCDRQGLALLAIPRKRLSVRGGEVSRGVVERNSFLERAACSLAESLGANVPITIQFRKSDRGFVAMEINARIGGGLPLTMAAGADWPRWIMQMAYGETPKVEDNVRDGVLMTRHDESVILNPIEKAIEPPDLSSVRLLIFDMDDTLYPEREFVFSGYKAVSKFVLDKYGLFVEDELKRRFEEGQRGDLFSTVLNSLGLKLSESGIKEIVAVYREHIPIIRPYSDTSLISKFKEAGYQVGLLSDGWSGVQKNKWASLGLSSLFDHVVFTDDFGRDFWKPHTKAFQHICSLAGLAPQQAVYIGDNPVKDFAGPNELGMKSIRIKRYGGEHSQKEERLGAGPRNYYIKSLMDLGSLLQKSHSYESLEASGTL